MSKLVLITITPDKLTKTPVKTDLPDGTTAIYLVPQIWTPDGVFMQSNNQAFQMAVNGADQPFLQWAVSAVNSFNSAQGDFKTIHTMSQLASFLTPIYLLAVIGGMGFYGLSGSLPAGQQTAPAAVGNV